jgi:predicted aspartyl protease
MTHPMLKALFISLFLVTSAAAEVPAATTVPFKLAENLIVVEAEINGVAGNYIVDTGAQAIVLNRPHFESANVNTVALRHASPSGANGTVNDVQGALDLSLSWNDIQIDGLQGLVMDLTHLEASVGVPIAGLIGFNVLEMFQIQFDYAAEELTLYSLDEDSQPLLENDLGSPVQVTEFEMMAHIPVFPVNIAGYDLRMGLDSGAGGAMLFTRWRDKLEGEYEFIERTELNGADKHVQMGDVVRIDNMRVQDIDYADMTFRFNDIASHNGNSMPMDGLLGYEFLKTRTTAINFRTRKLMIWPVTGG